MADLVLCSGILDCEFMSGRALFVEILWKVCPFLHLLLPIHLQLIFFNWVLAWGDLRSSSMNLNSNRGKWRPTIGILRGTALAEGQASFLSSVTVGKHFSQSILSVRVLQLEASAFCSDCRSNFLACIHSKPCFQLTYIKIQAIRFPRTGTNPHPHCRVSSHVYHSGF